VRTGLQSGQALGDSSPRPGSFLLWLTWARLCLEGVVKMKHYAKQLNRLSKQASVEKDPQKAQRLIEKIFQFIEAEQKGLSGNAPLNPAHFRSEQSKLVRATPIG